MARLQVLLAAVCFGTTGTAQALGPDASPRHGGRGAHRRRRRSLLLLAQRLTTRADAGRWARGPLAGRGAGRRRLPAVLLRRRQGHRRGGRHRRRARLGARAGRCRRLAAGPPRPRCAPGLPPPRWPAPASRCSRWPAAARRSRRPASRSPSAPAPPTPRSRSPPSACWTPGTASSPSWPAPFGWGAVLLVPVLVLGDLSLGRQPGGAAMALWLGADADRRRLPAVRRAACATCPPTRWRRSRSPSR